MCNAEITGPRGGASSEIRMIVAMGRDGAIGKDGDLIWHLRDDLRRFRSLTMGNVLVMGRKTWDSLPKHPLPGRRNIVVTRDTGFNAEGAETANSPEEALEMAGDAVVYVMGGAQIYNAMLPMADKIELTLIESECPDADAWLDIDFSLFRETESSDLLSGGNGVSFRFLTLERIKSRV